MSKTSVTFLPNCPWTDFSKPVFAFSIERLACPKAFFSLRLLFCTFLLCCCNSDKPRDCAVTFCRLECARGKHRNDHENGQKCRKQSRALGFENSIHLVFHSFHFDKEKALRFSAEDFVPYLVVVMRIRSRWRMIRRLVLRSRC